MIVVISSGHGKYVRGATGIIDEVDEARKVVKCVAQKLTLLGVEVVEFHDDVSTTQSENLDAIVDFHNSQIRDLDVSIHFNAYVPTDDPRGTECLYLTQEELADRVSSAVAEAGGLINRGPKKRTDLAFLNGTDEPAILIETCFVDSVEDTDLYDENFDDICMATAGSIIDKPIADAPTWPVRFKGKCSWFGGPDDTGVSSDEGLAFFYEVDDAPHLFLPEQPAGTTGLARRLDPDRPYVACRWDYDVTPKEMLAQPYPALIRASGVEMLAWPADWGPHEDTDRAADVSPSVMEKLGIETDDEIEVIYPAPLIFRKK